MTNKKKIIIGLQVVATVYLLGNMLYNNLQAFDLMSTAMGLISKYFDGNMVVLDSIQNGIAIGAQLRQMNGNADGWLLWVLSNIINIIVWASVGNWILVASFAAYAIVAISGYMNWSE